MTMDDYLKLRASKGLGLPQTFQSMSPQTDCRFLYGKNNFKHLGILEAEVRSQTSFCWDGSTVNYYGGGDQGTSTGGCGWYVYDGPIGWYIDSYMPSYIEHHGWAYFKTSCWYNYHASLEAIVWGNYYGGYGVYCSYDIVGPSPVDADCDWV